jgi:putative DNA primase/helicase
MLYGTGRNGKGTFLRLISALLGSANLSSVTPQSLDENRFRAAELHGKLANVAGDVDPRMFKGTELLKQLTGGDRVTAERKHGQPFSFTCRALMLAAFNQLPRTADTTEGFFSRWLVLPFVGYFPAGVADGTREAKLHSPAELQGLLVKAVEGLQRIRSRGCFAEPESVKAATLAFRTHADTMRSFISECCEASEKPGTHGRTRKELYGAWRDWNEQNGTQAGASSRFYERLASVATEVYGRPIRERKSNGQRLFDGIRLVDDWDDQLGM